MRVCRIIVITPQIDISVFLLVGMNVMGIERGTMDLFMGSEKWGYRLR